MAELQEVRESLLKHVQNNYTKPRNWSRTAGRTSRFPASWGPSPPSSCRRCSAESGRCNPPEPDGPAPQGPARFCWEGGRGGPEGAGKIVGGMTLQRERLSWMRRPRHSETAYPLAGPARGADDGVAAVGVAIQRLLGRAIAGDQQAGALPTGRATKVDPCCWRPSCAPRAVSTPSPNRASGAVGLMQVMPATAEQLAHELKMNYQDADDLYTQDINLTLGAVYFFAPTQGLPGQPGAGPGRLQRRASQGAGLELGPLRQRAGRPGATHAPGPKPAATYGTCCCTTILQDACSPSNAILNGDPDL